MYTKVFRQIYDGTLADNWQALVTFQQLLILADADGVVDMTIAAIHRTTGIPVEILQQGIAILEAPDHGSRTPDMEGRRIARLDEHREWGWKLVNFRKYRQMTSREDKKEADRARVAAKRGEEKPLFANDVATCRESSQPVAGCSDLSRSVADVAHTEAYTDTEQEQSSLRSDSSAPLALTAPAEPADLKVRRAERIQQIASEAQQAYNATLAKPHGILPVCSVLNRDRVKALEKVLPTVRLICRQQYGSERITAQFWADYFAEAKADDFASGRRGGGPGHENWKPDFEYLLRESVMVKLFDRAVSEDAA